uniref:Putative secreted protein n=1 Tax=Anopheles triannulatus TaxID=58253 RepID=A0A2M4B7E3_9DIPT
MIPLLGGCCASSGCSDWLLPLLPPCSTSAATCVGSAHALASCRPLLLLLLLPPSGSAAHPPAIAGRWAPSLPTGWLPPLTPSRTCSLPHALPDPAPASATGSCYR